MPAKRSAQPEPVYLDSDHEAIVTFGNTYFDDEEERAAFIDTLMERRGYRQTTGWSLPEEEEQPEPEPPGRRPRNGGAPAPGPRQPARPVYFRK